MVQLLQLPAAAGVGLAIIPSARAAAKYSTGSRAAARRMSESRMKATWSRSEPSPARSSCGCNRCVRPPRWRRCCSRAVAKECGSHYPKLASSCTSARRRSRASRRHPIECARDPPSQETRECDLCEAHGLRHPKDRRCALMGHVSDRR